MANCTTEFSSKKNIDQFKRQRGANHFRSQAKNIHVVIFDTLMG